MPKKVFEAYRDSKKSLADSLEVERGRVGMKRGGGSENLAFLITCFDFFYNKNHSKNELLECITDGHMDLSLCDIVYYHPDGVVDIFDIRESDKAVSSARIAEAKYALNNFFLRKPKDLSECNPLLKAQVEKAHKAGVKTVNLYFLRKEKRPVKGLGKELKNGLNLTKIITIEELVKRRLQNNYLPVCCLSPEEEAMHVDAREKSQFNSVILKVPLSELLRVHSEHLAKGIDFFASNVRNPKKNLSFATGLEQTIKSEPEKFHLYHNGVTMTASKIKKNGATYEISEPQVVNGGQTLGNIADLVNQGKVKREVPVACVICKIIKADEDQIDEICEASNTQRKVSAVELRSNDGFQKELSLFVDSVGNGNFSYIRKPHQGRTPKGGITLDKFFQWSHSGMRRKPHEAKTLKNRLFSKSRKDYTELSKLIKRNSANIERLCTTGLFVEDTIRAISDKEKKGLARDMNNHITARLYCIGKKKRSDVCDSSNFELAFEIFRDAYKRVKSPYLDSGSFFKMPISALEKYFK